MTMDVSGFWTGEYSYDAVNGVSVSFQAELSLLGAILSGNTTEQNTFDEQAGQILIAELFGKVSGQDISFTKTYSNSPMGKDKVLYKGVVSNDGKSITGTWTIAGMWNGSFKMTKAIEQKPSPKAVSARETADA